LASRPPPFGGHTPRSPPPLKTPPTNPERAPSKNETSVQRARSFFPSSFTFQNSAPARVFPGGIALGICPPFETAGFPLPAPRSRFVASPSVCPPFPPPPPPHAGQQPMGVFFFFFFPSSVQPRFEHGGNAGVPPVGPQAKPPPAIPWPPSYGSTPRQPQSRKKKKKNSPLKAAPTCFPPPLCRGSRHALVCATQVVSVPSPPPSLNRRAGFLGPRPCSLEVPPLPVLKKIQFRRKTPLLAGRQPPFADLLVRTSKRQGPGRARLGSHPFGTPRPLRVQKNRPPPGSPEFRFEKNPPLFPRAMKAGGFRFD